MHTKNKTNPFLRCRQFKKRAFVKRIRKTIHIFLSCFFSSCRHYTLSIYKGKNYINNKFRYVKETADLTIHCITKLVLACRAVPKEYNPTVEGTSDKQIDQ